MPEYLLSARDRNGRTVTESVEAFSADDAVQTLRDEGYRSIILHTDEVMAAVTRPNAAYQRLSPRLRVLAARRLLGGYLPWALFMLRMVFAKTWITYALLIFLLIALVLLNRSWGILQSFTLMVLLAPFLIAFVTPLIGSVSRYMRLLKAASWGRWEDVLRMLPTLPKSVPAHSKSLRHAEALAGLGRLDEALGVFEPFADNGEIPEWLYWLYIAEIYAAARQGNDVVRAVEKAAALAPENSTVLIRCALSLLRFKPDTKRASELLQRARAHAVSDLTAPSLEIAEGMLVLEAGDSAEARKRLESALAKLKRLRMGSVFGAVRDLAHAYLAIACAQIGETKLARHHFHRAAPRMRARGWDDLMQRCEHALGHAASAQV